MEKQFVLKLLEMSKNFELEKCDHIDMSRTHTPFEGTPKKHPTDENILLLFSHPFSEKRGFFEFAIDSIDNIENLGTITTSSGESVYTIRVWVKKGEPGLKAEPFIVD